MTEVDDKNLVISRRSVLRATAWTAPVVAMATVAPAAAAASVMIPDPVLPVENPLPIPEPTLPQIPVPQDLKTVPPPIPGVPPGPGQPSVVLPDKIPPKIFKPKNGQQQSSVSEPTLAPTPTTAAPSPQTTNSPTPSNTPAP